MYISTREVSEGRDRSILIQSLKVQARVANQHWGRVREHAVEMQRRPVGWRAPASATRPGRGRDCTGLHCDGVAAAGSRQCRPRGYCTVRCLLAVRKGWCARSLLAIP